MKFQNNSRNQLLSFCVVNNMSTEKTLPASLSIPLPVYTAAEETANSILHGAGFIAAAAGLVLLCLKTNGVLGGHRAADLDIAAAAVFTTAMTGMFLASTLYHAVQRRRVKRILQIMDHSAIFVFIAGTYTPFCLSVLKGVLGWSIFASQWSLALLGIILNVMDSKALKKIETAAYIIMGWIIIVGSVPLIRSAPVRSIVLLFAGGAAYTVGTFWYRKKNIRHTHTVWHIFVMIGTLCHWCSVWFLY
jgi:hemolysin III